MFIAKFSQVSVDSEKFEADDNGNMPFIGEVLSGIAKASIINGTIFNNAGLLPNVMYACETKEVEGTKRDGSTATFTNVVVLDRVSIMEYAQLRKELGAGRLVREEQTANATAETARNINDLLED